MTKKNPQLDVYKYRCDECRYNTNNKKDYTKHNGTAKHMRLMNTNGNSPKNPQYDCQCGKSYKHMSSLCKHKANCTLGDDTHHDTSSSSQMDMTLVFDLLKQNRDFKELMIEQSKQLADQQQQNKLLLEQQHHQNSQLLEAVKDGKLGNTINNTTNNNKFNLNFFLNETCKDAITMNEFINSIEVSMDDFIRTGNIGFIDGISKVMVERIKDMELHARPMHCTDLKRETLYIKNEDKWEKEDTDKTSLRHAVKKVANKNYKQLQKWYDSSKPNVEQIGSEDCENYFKYYKASLGGYDKEEDKKFEEKIIKNVLKEVVLDRNT